MSGVWMIGYLDERHSGPSCPNHAHVRVGERAIVSKVVEGLLGTGWLASQIAFEYRLERGSRADVVAVGPKFVLVVECKAVMIQPSDLPQARRYLDAALRRWPERRVEVALVAPMLSSKLPPETPSLWYGTV